MRGYAVTRDREFLDVYYRAKNNRHSDDTLIDGMHSDDRSVDKAVADMRPIADDLDGRLLGAIASVSHQTSDATKALLRSEKAASDDYRRHDARVEALVDHERANRRRMNASYFERATFFPPVAAIIIVLGAIAIFRLARNTSSMERAAQRAKDLEELNSLMAMAEQMMNVGYWRLDLRTRERHWSAETYRIHGLSPGDPLPTETVLSFYAPDDRERIAGIIAATLAQGTSGQLERAPDGAPLILKGSFQDITDRKNSEREMDRLITRINAATQASRVGIWDWDIETGEIVWDAMMYALYGYSQTQVAASYETWAAALHADDRERAKRELAYAVSSGMPFDTEFRIVWPTGEVHNIRAMASLIRDSNGCPQRMIGTNWDVTELRTIAEKLHVTAERDRLTAATLHETNRLMAMAEQLGHIGHWRLDLTSNELYWSEDVYRTHGLGTTHKPTLESALAAYHPEDRDATAAIVSAAIADGASFSFEARIVRRTGRSGMSERSDNRSMVQTELSSPSSAFSRTLRTPKRRNASICGSSNASRSPPKRVTSVFGSGMLSVTPWCGMPTCSSSLGCR